LFQAEPGTPGGDRLEVIVLLIEDDERHHHPVPPPDPIAALLYAMESVRTEHTARRHGKLSPGALAAPGPGSPFARAVRIGSEGSKPVELGSARQYIVATPGIAGGKPRIDGHRITVQNVVEWHEHSGWCPDEIAEGYSLTLAEVHAALAYYFDHREEIDRAIREDREFAQALRHTSPSPLTDKLRERAHRAVADPVLR
jgi:uncharacterized protein (DUF433 family)